MRSDFLVDAQIDLNWMIDENCNAKWLKGAPYLHPEGSEGSLFNKEGLRLLIPYKMKAELLDPQGGNSCNALCVLSCCQGSTSECFYHIAFLLKEFTDLLG